jgi:hypothetical protein
MELLKIMHIPLHQYGFLSTCEQIYGILQ